MIIVNTNNVHRNERKRLKEHLEHQCWDARELNADEYKALFTLVVASLHKNNNKTALTYTELLNLKNKLYL